MLQQTLTRDVQRARLREELRRVLFDGMKKAELSQNWGVFNHYMYYYMKLAS